MTKKDYERIAEVFRCLKPLPGGLVRRLWADTVISMANAYAEDNPRFNRERFYAACNYEE